MNNKSLLWIAALVVALAAGWQLASAQVEKGKAAQKWEYKSVHKFDEVVAAGEEGWELVLSMDWNDSRTVRYVLKRPK